MARSVTLANLLHGCGITLDAAMLGLSYELSQALFLTTAPVALSPVFPVSNLAVDWGLLIARIPCTLFDFSESIAAGLAAVRWVPIDPSGTQLLIAPAGLSTYTPRCPGTEFTVHPWSTQAVRGQRLFANSRVARICLMQRTFAELPVSAAVLLHIPLSLCDSVAGGGTRRPWCPR